MNLKIIKEKNNIGGKLVENAPLKKLNTWHVGGIADYLYQPDSEDSLQQFFTLIPKDYPIHFLGLGSNVLVADKGVRGIVIVTSNALTDLIIKDSNTVYSSAGVTCAKLAKFAAKNNLTGANFFAGIPGTVGGALAMNAGAFGGETWNSVINVRLINRSGKIFYKDKQDFLISYRKVEKNQDEWFLAATFGFEYGDSLQEQKNIRALVQKRNLSQPIGKLSCGSVFVNPKNHHAANLIEQCGLKGYSIGNAQISEKHANFIINNGECKAADIVELITLTQTKVKQQFNIDLQPEVKFLGEFDC